MAISIDWGTKVITVPKADTTFITNTPYEIRELNMNTFRLAIADLQDNFDGMPYDTVVEHTGPVTVGGVTLDRVVEIINGYTLTFENGAYAVNLVGGNNNIADVLNLNNVSIRSANSAGLQLVSIGSGLSAGQDTKLNRIHELLDVIEGTLDHQEVMRILLSAMAGKVAGAAGTNITFRDLADTKNRIDATVDQDGNRTSVTVDAS